VSERTDVSLARHFGCTGHEFFAAEGWLTRSDGCVPRDMVLERRRFELCRLGMALGVLAATLLLK